MGELPTIAIHSPKDEMEKWVINLVDYDPSIHRKWGDEFVTGEASQSAEDAPDMLDEPTMSDEPDWIDADEPEPIIPSEPEVVPDRHHMTPSHQDFISDSDGNIVTVNIIDPDRRTSRKEIPVSEYDPDRHQLWSSHPRFNR